jgi:hypothetical protein
MAPNKRNKKAAIQPSSGVQKTSTRTPTSATAEPLHVAIQLTDPTLVNSTAKSGQRSLAPALPFVQGQSSHMIPLSNLHTEMENEEHTATQTQLLQDLGMASEKRTADELLHNNTQHATASLNGQHYMENEITMDVDIPQFKQQTSALPANEVSCKDLLKVFNKTVGPELVAPARQYKSAFVFMLYWEDDDLDSYKDLRELETVFNKQFGYSVKYFSIPSLRSKMSLQRNLVDFLHDHDSVENLLIVCYAGHKGVRVDLNGGHKSFWSPSTMLTTQMDLTDVHNMLLSAEPESSVVYLMDCFHGSLAPVTSSLNMETLFVRPSIAQGVSSSKNTFIQIITAELRSLAAANMPFSVAQLHAQITESYLKDGAHTLSFAPIYTPLGLTGSPSIVLEPLATFSKESNFANVASEQENAIAAVFKEEQKKSIAPQWLTPLVRFHVRVQDSPSASYDQWANWCADPNGSDTPSLLGISTLRVRDLITLEAIHGVDEINSSIWTMTMPEFMFRMGPSEQPYIKYIMLVKSTNLLPTPGSLVLRKARPIIKNEEMENTTENTFGTVTLNSWWAYEDRWTLTENMSSEKVRNLIKFAELKSANAFIAANNGFLHEAEQLCRDVTTRMEKDVSWKDIGMSHPFALNAVKNLGLVYRSQKQFNDAEVAFQDLWIRCSEQYGQDHYWSHNSAHHLGVVHRELGNIEKAETLLNTIVNSRTKTHGQFDLLMLATKHQLALVYQDQNRDTEAEALHMDVINSFVAGRDEAHTLVIAASNGLAGALRKQGRDVEAMVVEASVRRLASKDLTASF